MSGDDDRNVPEYLRGVQQAGFYDQHPKRKTTPAPAHARMVGLERPQMTQEAPLPGRKLFSVVFNLMLFATIAFMLVMIVLCSGIGIGAKQVGDWEREVRAKQRILDGAVADERAIIGDFAALGADRGTLERLYADYDAAEGYARGHRALEVAQAVEEMSLQVADFSGSPAAVRQRRLRVPADEYENAYESWESWSGGVLGFPTCLLRLARCPP